MDKSLLLCVSTLKGYAVLRAMHEEKPDVKLHVTTFEEKNVAVRYDEKIQKYAKLHGIPVYSWDEITEGGIIWLEQRNILSIICVGWRYMIPDQVLERLRYNVLVTHDSLLPRYRGFAPLASAMINGDKKVGVSVIRASNEVDAGDIIYQKSVDVEPTDCMSDLIRKLLPLFTEGVVQSVEKVLCGELVGTPQDHSLATYSIWRDETDLWIDWNDSSHRIERMVRALGAPYMGARTRIEDKIIVIHSAVVVDDLRFEIRQPGKVWCLNSDSKPIVVCGEGMLLLENATINGEPLFPMKKVRVRFGGE